MESNGKSDTSTESTTRPPMLCQTKPSTSRSHVGQRRDGREGTGKGRDKQESRKVNLLPRERVDMEEERDRIVELIEKMHGNYLRDLSYNIILLENEELNKSLFDYLQMVGDMELVGELTRLTLKQKGKLTSE